ncbi:uncharacterized protein LOC106417211 [Brassica napus]|uniref:uncharacterized protein LOC106417211 n=1 Tax=Brassica napus TaxID=3708 RepID=UPI0006AB6F72|nr:uncharacterized protein LOC106417211 [Brassica napus]
MRQVIIMDGTHLKVVYKGVLRIATAQDPDHHHYPLAFAVVDGEKNASWEWFLTILKTLIPDDHQLVFCTDRNQSIIKKVHEVYPLAIHGYCNYHLSNNVSGACSNVNKKGVAKKIRNIAGIYSEVEFRKYYSDFRKMYPQAAEYLDDSVHETKWARCKFPGERYFDIDRYPCVHALAAIMARGEMAEHYCSRLSSLRMWRKKKERLQVTTFPSAGEYQRKRKKKFPPLIGENKESGSDGSGSDSNSSGSDISDSSGSEGNGDEGGDNEGNDE